MKIMISKYKKVLAILWGVTLIVGVLLSIYYLRTHAMTFKEGVILMRAVTKSGLM